MKTNNLQWLLREGVIAMEIIEIRSEFLKDVVELAECMYSMECKYVAELKRERKEELHKWIEEAIDNQQGVVCIVQGKVVGYMLFTIYSNEDSICWCMVPVWGYGAIEKAREKILSKMFQNVADILCRKQKVHFEIKVYAHDEEAIRLFTLLQFGIQCEEEIRNTEVCILVKTDVSIRELGKNEIENRWSEVWKLIFGLIEHLRKSPIFYPGTEFTEELYRDYFMDIETHVYIAEKENRIIGLMDANREGNSFITNDESCFSVSDIFVIEEYRGNWIARELLSYVNDTLRDKGIRRLWVEHGTANPNARGFWNKYFSTFSYTLVRDIDYFSLLR